VITAETRIAVASDFNADNLGHRATNEALRHAADALGLDLTVDWISTETTASEGGRAVLEGYHGIFSAGGAYQSKNGALEAIRFARERGWPFVAT
jgi:CTP synthase (UTP-ammonia lyase)